jgi:aconitate hydratase
MGADMPTTTNPFDAEARLTTKAGDVRYYSLPRLARSLGVSGFDRLPFSIRVLLESCLRNLDGFQVNESDVRALAAYEPSSVKAAELPFKPARVILQDFTGVPAVVDLAAMRSAMKRAGGDPQRINPLVPVDLVIDHSVQVDEFGTSVALAHNVEKEFERNRERYEFLKWGQRAFRNFSVVPPATGIVHQVNLEHLGQVVMRREDGVAMPDSLVGTDSHTTMINGLGIVGWGVGGIEAEACMLGQPIYLVTPQVVGFRLHGQLPEGATATDLVLTVTQMLRAFGVVEKFIEFFGEGLASMTVADRATIANMAPEYGATIGLFPVDEQTLAYLRLTGRSPQQIDLVERYCKQQGLWRQKDSTPSFAQVLELDLATVKPSLAGPRRPQDRVELAGVAKGFRKAFAESLAKAGAETTARNGGLEHGKVVIAAITSCTNTSNPSVMVAAGLVARNAVRKGLKVPAYVKTSLSPGSRVVTDYFNKAGLQESLDQLGFQTTGYGCMTCIGNSGPLPEAVASEIEKRDLVVASVLSGNRNFEGRINPHVRANYLASPPLVVAYALAGTVDIDLTSQPLGTGRDGKSVYLRDIWPTLKEVADVIGSAVEPGMFTRQYHAVGTRNPEWNAIPVKGGELFEWDAASTYIQEPPFFQELSPQPAPITPIRGARVLVMVGDSVTTDHISPAGSIKKDSPAGKFLIEHGVQPLDFNSYGARRGNDRVMTRGTFANIRLKNLLAPGTEGGVTRHLPDGQVMPVHQAAMAYKESRTPLIVLAGKDYGMGSSRDWAAKGTALLGVRAVIAESLERIHRSNLVGMGVLPLVYKPGQTRASLGLDGAEQFDIAVSGELRPMQDIAVRATRADGKVIEFTTTCRVDTPVEVEYYRNGGILHTVLRKMLQESKGK